MKSSDKEALIKAHEEIKSILNGQLECKETTELEFEKLAGIDFHLNELLKDK